MYARHRLFVLTDIENEPDDTQSLVRLLLYSNEIDIEGLVAVNSTWIRHRVHPETIHSVLSAYSTVRPNLLRISDAYPTAEALAELVGEGVRVYGMEGVGEGHDTSGSEKLINAVDRKDDQGRPLHVALWGGANCLAQALWKVRKTRSPEQVKEFIAKIRVYAISDQDDAGPWIRRNFPTIPFVVSVHGENCYLSSTWIGFASNDINGLSGAQPEMVKNPWLKEHIQLGPLGSMYPDVMYGMEGDTPSYLNLIPNGLNDPERPDFGGWGGRYKKIFDLEAEHYHDTLDEVASTVDGAIRLSAAATIWRWRDTVQYDFANRMQWTIEQDASKLKFPPVVVVDGDKSGDFIEVSAKCSETLEFDASESTSPHGAEVSFKWIQYKEIDSIITIPRDVPDFDMHGTENSSKLKITMPAKTVSPQGQQMSFEDGRTYHIILAVTSAGDLPLTRYRRIMVHVTP